MKRENHSAAVAFVWRSETIIYLSLFNIHQLGNKSHSKMFCSSWWAVKSFSTQTNKRDWGPEMKGWRILTRPSTTHRRPVRNGLNERLPPSLALCKKTHNTEKRTGVWKMAAGALNWQVKSRNICPHRRQFVCWGVLSSGNAEAWEWLLASLGLISANLCGDFVRIKRLTDAQKYRESFCTPRNIFNKKRLGQENVITWIYRISSHSI